jgi:polyhydroxyalkanoate synthesis regulator phasin
MTKTWKIVGIVALVAILGAAAAGAVVYAQDDGSGGPFDFHGKFREAIAEILGITVDEYDAAVEQAQDQVVDEALAEGWLTEEQAELLQWRMDRAPGLRMPDMGRGWDDFGHGAMGGGDSLLSIAADKLGMSLTDLLTELENDKTIADVAAEKGVDTQVIVDAYLAQVKDNLDEAVAEGRITQNQADYQLEKVEERATGQLDNTGLGGFHGGGRHGGSRGFPGLGGF